MYGLISSLIYVGACPLSAVIVSFIWIWLMFFGFLFLEQIQKYSLLWDICLENYISMHIPKHIRSTVSVQGTIAEDRDWIISGGGGSVTCKFCNLNEIEEEFHFLLKYNIPYILTIWEVSFIKVSVFQTLLIQLLFQTLIFILSRQTASICFALK